MISHKISRKTMFWVCVAHVLVLLLAVFLAHVLTPTPPPKMLEMIGLPDNINPANGEPSAKQRGPAIPNQPSQPTQPQQSSPTPPPPQPAVQTPPTPPQPQVQTPPEPQPRIPVKNDFPTEPVQPKPKKPKPTVQPNLNPTTRNTVTPSLTPAITTPRSNSTGNASSNGVSASSIERSLSNAIGGDTNAGVRNGLGDQGSSGSPTGNKNGDWYRSLIKNTIERRWMKPQSTNPNLTATVRIRVLADGTIEYLGLTSGSGDTEMDNSVISAVRNAGKVSMPPPDGFPKPYEDTVIFRLKGDM
jgi:TonB family protein